MGILAGDSVKGLMKHGLGIEIDDFPSGPNAWTQSIYWEITVCVTVTSSIGMIWKNFKNEFLPLKPL